MKKRKFYFLNLLIIFIPVFLLCAFIMLCYFDNFILPSTIEVANSKIKKQVNYIINESVKELLKTENLSSKDFFLNGNDDFVSFSVDTMLINDICTKLSENVSNNMQNLRTEEVSVPISIVTNIGLISHFGPEFTFGIQPVGESSVNYETSFYSVGINQTNFKIWLNVSVEVEIVNPLVNEKRKYERKVMLIDTVIKGDVPSVYLNGNYENN